MLCLLCMVNIINCFRLPYFLGEIGPGHPAVETNTTELTAMRLEMTELRQLLLFSQREERLYLRAREYDQLSLGGGVQREQQVTSVIQRRQLSSGVEELSTFQLEAEEVVTAAVADNKGSQAAGNRTQVSSEPIR